MVTFEDMLKSQGGHYDLCRNGLKVRHHPINSQEIFGDEVEDFEEDIKILERQTGQWNKALKHRAEIASN